MAGADDVVLRRVTVHGSKRSGQRGLKCTPAEARRALARRLRWRETRPPARRRESRRAGRACTDAPGAGMSRTVPCSTMRPAYITATRSAVSAIHNTGNRSKAPFVAVSCGAIPENLIEAELFGHEKGAFTGSIGAREGYFERAGDGTLFLDEIGELNQATQVKLLRVLQGREFNRLGSGRSIPLRARILFATHRDLPQMTAEGTFRQDLFYRVNVMNIVSPALREHSEDIPQLVHHFVRHYSDLYRKPVEVFEPDALAFCSGMTGRATFASWRMPSSARSLCPRKARSAPAICRTRSATRTSRNSIGDLPAGSFERLLPRV